VQVNVQTYLFLFMSFILFACWLLCLLYLHIDDFQQFFFMFCVHGFCYTDEVSNDVVIYWKQKADVWPQLARVSRGLLGVPATSTSSERSFSLAGRTLEERRSQLSGPSVDGLLFLHGL